MPRLCLAGLSLLVASFLGAQAGLAGSQTEVGLGNPASIYCARLGGSLSISSDGRGETGHCELPGGEVCEEWALFRGECGPGGHIPDPFRYCAEEGESGIISDARTGGQFPDVLTESMIAQGLISSDLPAGIRSATQWRCMDGQVSVCPVGANIPCAEKADLSRQPSDSMVAYCRSYPGSAAIPAYVTGRATVYAWDCVDRLPRIKRQVLTADSAGFLAEFWHAVIR